MRFWPRREKREYLMPQSSPELLQVFGIQIGAMGFDDILGVPAVMAARSFLAGTIAGLPLHVYRVRRDGTKERLKANGNLPLVGILHDAVNDGLSSFQWRFDMFASGVLTTGRDVTYIERDGQGRIVNLFPLPGATVRRQTTGRLVYTYRAGGKTVEYDESQVLDVTFMRASDRLTAISPIRQCFTALTKAAAANAFGTKVFENGGLPAYALQGPFESGDGARRAQANIEQVTKDAVKNGRSVIAMPLGHELKPLGANAEEMQLVEVQRFMVEEVARVFSLPPVFLQDLSHGTYTNTEQQDLHFVKHTLKRWVEQLEQEMTLKFFGRRSDKIVEFNLDGLLRGDFSARMEGWATAIQNGIRTPNEAREKENLPPLNGGDQLYIQGATVPLTQSGEVPSNGGEDGQS